MCTKTYLLSKKETHCMGCKVGWTDAVCTELLGGFMHREYRIHTTKLLWEMEKARMPETMPSVERELKKRKMIKEYCDLSVEVQTARTTLRNIEKIQRQLKHNIEHGNIDGSSKEQMEKKKKEFIRACPVNDCAGFLSSQWKCGVCEIWVCKDCMEVKGKEKDTEHVCDENVLASAQLLKKETKPCPSCSAAIFKISGCDQMWCTQCQVAFSWRTGLKMTGTIHNPHFYQWQKQNGEARQNPGAIACGGLPDWGNFQRILANTKFAEFNDIGFGRYYVRHQAAFMAYLASKGFKKWGQKHSLRYVIPQTVPLDVKLHLDGVELGTPSFVLKAPTPVPGPTYKNTNKDYTIPSSQITTIYIKNNLPVDEGGLETTTFWDIKIPDVICAIYEFCNELYVRHRCASHFENVELDRYRRKVNQQENHNDNQKKRVLYILKELKEDGFKMSLMKEDRKNKKERAILDIFEVFNTVIGDCIRVIYAGILPESEYKNKCGKGFNAEKLIDMIYEQITRMENIRKYCNIELLKISKTYKQVAPLILPDGYTQTVYWDNWKPLVEKWGFDDIFNKMAAGLSENYRHTDQKIRGAFVSIIGRHSNANVRNLGTVIPELMKGIKKFNCLNQEENELFENYIQAYNNVNPRARRRRW